MRQHQLQGTIYCLIATASWGAMFPVMTGALVRIDPFTFLGQKMIGSEGALAASIIAAMMPMLGLLANWAVGKAKPSIYSFLFMPLSLCGVALVVTRGHFAGLADSSSDFRADVLMIIGASCRGAPRTGGR